MPRCNIQSVEVLAMKDIKSAISSYIGSLRYMKKIVPLTIYNIVYNRVDFEEELFSEKSVCNILFQTPKAKVKNNIVADIYFLAKGIAEAIERKYLRQMHLIFFEKSDNSIRENYKYTLTYQDEPNTKLPNSEDIIRITRELFESIKSLSEYKKMNKDIGLSIEIICADDIEAKHYVPPHFAQPITLPLCLQLQEKSDYTPVASVKTGYHKLKCAVTGIPFDTMSKANTSVHVDDTNVDETVIIEPDAVEDQVNDLDDRLTNVSQLEETELDKDIDVDSIRDSPGFRCPCNVNALVGSSKSIKCTVCKTRQHTICVGCINEASIVQPYVCVYCDSPNTHAFDKYLLNHQVTMWETICAFRLVLHHCCTYKKIPVQIWDKIENNVKKQIKSFIKKESVMKLEENMCVINPEAMAGIMTQLFVDYRLPDSMVLGETMMLD